MTSANDFRGAFFMILSMAGFAISDATIKLLSSELPLFQAIFLRGGLVTLLLAVIAWQTGVLSCRLDARNSVMLAVRAVGEACGAVCLLIAFVNMPIVNATAIVQVMPLTVTLGAAYLFAERVGARRYMAILIGFIGVLIVIRPGMDGFTIYALWAVGTVLLFTIRDLATRQLSNAVPSIFAAFVTSIAVVLLAGCLSLGEAWEPLGAHELSLLALAAAFTIVGYVFSVMTMRVGDVSVVAPFRYSILLWALVLGFLLFGEVPDVMTLFGSCLIVIAGGHALVRKPAPIPQPIKV